MSFVKNGDAEIIEIIADSKKDDRETEEALETVRQAAKNLDTDGNKKRFSRESE